MEISKFRPNYQIITVQGSSKTHALFLVFFLIYSFPIFALSFIVHLLKPLGSSLFFFIVSEGRCGTGIWSRAAFPTMISCLVGAFTSVPFSPPPTPPRASTLCFYFPGYPLHLLFSVNFWSTFYFIFNFSLPFPLNSPPPPQEMLAYFPEIIN